MLSPSPFTLHPVLLLCSMLELLVSLDGFSFRACQALGLDGHRVFLPTEIVYSVLLLLSVPWVGLVETPLLLFRENTFCIRNV